MRNRLFLLSTCLFICITLYLVFVTTQDRKPVESPSLTSAEIPQITRSVSSTKTEDTKARQAYEHMRLRNPETDVIPQNMRARELAFAKKLPIKRTFSPKQRSAETWSYRGPDNVGGRTRALAIDINFDGSSNRRILAGGVSGGMYKSEDGGASWELTSNLDEIASVTAVAQDPSNPNTWYYGTGEFDGNSASGFGASYLGFGMYKSTDGGNSWTLLESTTSGEFTNFGNGPNDPVRADDLFDFVWDIEVHPNGTVYVGGWGVILTSTDGGATWTNSLETLGNSADIAIASDGSVYGALSREGTNTPAANFGIFRQNGSTWTQISPTNLVGDPYRIVLDVAPSDPNTVYAFVQTTAAGGQTSEHQLFRYNASTNTWTDLSASLPSETAPGPGGASPLDGGPAGIVSQGGYNMLIKVSPENPNTFWLGGTNLYRTTDGGATYTRVGGYASPYTAAVYNNHYVDQHSMAFYPHLQNALISGNDGGLFTTNNALQGTQTWTPLNNGYRTAQFYSIALDPSAGSPNFLIGGMQDNGSFTTEVMDGTADWRDVFSGDGGFADVVPGGNTFYASAQLGDVFRFRQQGIQLAFTNVSPANAQDFLFITPYTLDPGNANVMYIAAGDRVWRNSNLNGIPDFQNDPTTMGWSQLTNATGNGLFVTALGVPDQGGVADVMYFGTSNGQTSDLIRVDNPAANGPGTSILPTGVVPGSFTSSISINEFDEQEMLVTYSNYSVPSVFHSTDGGATWTNIEGNLSGDDGPSVRWSHIMPVTGGAAYFLATSTGIYSTRSLNGASTVWELEGPDSIGNVVVNMLDGRSSDGLLVAATHGRGVYSANVAEAGNPVSNEDEIELPQTARLDQNYPNPFNPETTISYELGRAGQIELAVFDATGRRIRVLESGLRNAGTHEIQWNGRDENGITMASGTYFYRLQVLGNELGSEQVLTGQMVLLK